MTSDTPEYHASSVVLLSGLNKPDSTAVMVSSGSAGEHQLLEWLSLTESLLWVTRPAFFGGHHSSLGHGGMTDRAQTELIATCLCLTGWRFTP